MVLERSTERDIGRNNVNLTVYRPRRGRIMETKQTTGKNTSATQHIKPCLIPQLLIRKFDPCRVVNAKGGH